MIAILILDVEGRGRSSTHRDRAFFCLHLPLNREAHIIILLLGPVLLEEAASVDDDDALGHLVLAQLRLFKHERVRGVIRSQPLQLRPSLINIDIFVQAKMGPVQMVTTPVR